MLTHTHNHPVGNSLNKKRILFVGASRQEIASPKKMGIPLDNPDSRYNFIVAVDGGANWCRKHRVRADAFIGDEDTLHESSKHWIKKTTPEIISCNSQKDDTDLSLAFKTFLPRFSDEACDVDCIGVLGGKLEHLLGVLGVLQRTCPHYPHYRFWLRGVSQTVCVLSQPGNTCVEMVKEHLTDEGDSFSVIPLTRCVVSEKGCEWNLQRKVLHPLTDRGISNKVKTKDARIIVHRGVVLAFFSRS